MKKPDAIMDDRAIQGNGFDEDRLVWILGSSRSGQRIRSANPGSWMLHMSARERRAMLDELGGALLRFGYAEPEDLSDQEALQLVGAAPG